MKIAVIGSRTLFVPDLGRYLPSGLTEIVSGGARGVDTCARAYARENNIPLAEFLPDYALFGRRAPLERNLQIIRYADAVVAFWDGKSRGTFFVLSSCRQCGKPLTVYKPDASGRFLPFPFR